MSLGDVFRQLGFDFHNLGILGWIIFFLLTFIQIAPIKLNPWSWIARQIGRAINGELFEKVEKLEEMANETNEKANKIEPIESKVDNLESKMSDMEKKADVKDANNVRNRILRFSDECRVHVKHSKEYFDQILEDVDFYEKYCEEHDDYKNSKANEAIRIIRDAYHKAESENDFA